MKVFAKTLIQKKAYSKKGLCCTYCKKSGHTRQFCPLRPTEPQPSDISVWADNLMKLSNVQPPTSVGNWISEGTLLNKGNPWENSVNILDSLRKRLGYWKALGANSTSCHGLPTASPCAFQVNHKDTSLKTIRRTTTTQSFLMQKSTVI